MGENNEYQQTRNGINTYHTLLQTAFFSFSFLLHIMYKSRSLIHFSMMYFVISLFALFIAINGFPEKVLGQTKPPTGSSKKPTGKTSKSSSKSDSSKETAKPASATPRPSSGQTLPPSKPLEDAPTAGGTVKEANSLPRSPKRPSQALKFTAEERILPTTTGTLWGTLLVPTTATTTASVPIIFILNTNTLYNRDGISRHYHDSSNHAKYLAEALAAQGIASFRYDTRGAGKSREAFVNEEFHDFERTISDACLWVDSLRKDKRFSTLTILGLSRSNDFGREGSLAGIQVAYRQQADGLIMVAPDSRRWLRYLRAQAYQTFPEASAKIIDSVAGLLEEGRRPYIKPNEGIIFDLMRYSLQNYILSLNKYDPIVEIAKLNIPIIGVHGTMDLTISDEYTRNLVAANPKAKFFSIKNMTFNLKNGEKDLSTPPQEKIKIPIMPEVVDLFTDFVLSLEK